jgi:hypothetical protein
MSLEKAYCSYCGSLLNLSRDKGEKPTLWEIVTLRGERVSSWPWDQNQKWVAYKTTPHGLEKIAESDVFKLPSDWAWGVPLIGDKFQTDWFKECNKRSDNARAQLVSRLMAKGWEVLALDNFGDVTSMRRRARCP